MYDRLEDLLGRIRLGHSSVSTNIPDYEKATLELLEDIVYAIEELRSK